LGLIRRRKDGNRVYFRAETENPLFKDISRLVLKTAGLADVIREALEGVDVDFAFVFGSVASGTQKPVSDIDLFVIGRIRLRALSKLLKTPCEALGREINAHIMTAEEFAKRKRQKEHFVSSIHASPKLMVIGEEDDLAELG
ncbi:MAG: toxin-antitoxin system toxin subunit, partial [Chitinivibrionales bacterium]|nr:toxin-antitoxin system toxin subunit [Chitinivibrionales bacterium]MBD3396776.1 toxin-antitoxin system toxin subunit [Chitinivibrionales bacterium]